MKNKHQAIIQNIPKTHFKQAQINHQNTQMEIAKEYFDDNMLPKQNLEKLKTKLHEKKPPQK